MQTTKQMTVIAPNRVSKNGKSRENGNIWHTRYRAKTNKRKNTKQKTKKMSKTDLTKQGLDPGVQEW
jgi:hypothetical protein